MTLASHVVNRLRRALNRWLAAGSPSYNLPRGTEVHPVYDVSREDMPSPGGLPMRGDLERIGRGRGKGSDPNPDFVDPRDCADGRYGGTDPD